MVGTNKSNHSFKGNNTNTQLHFYRSLYAILITMPWSSHLPYQLVYQLNTSSNSDKRVLQVTGSYLIYCSCTFRLTLTNFKLKYILYLQLIAVMK